MVVIEHWAPTLINAYSTVPLTQSTVQLVQHAIYNGSRARFGDPQMQVTILDRPEFHGVSNYDLRTILDKERQLDPFLIIDTHTAEKNAVWYVPDTQTCKNNSDPTKGENPPVIYPDEGFILWQALVRTEDIPLEVILWMNDDDTFFQDVQKWYHDCSYDSHHPPSDVISRNIDWTSSKSQAEFWGKVMILATWSEVEISYHPVYPPLPPGTKLVRLRREVARDAGLLPTWVPPFWSPEMGERFRTFVYYDWRNPKWPKAFPDDASRLNHRISSLSLPMVRQNNTRAASNICQRRKRPSKQCCR